MGVSLSDYSYVFNAYLHVSMWELKISLWFLYDSIGLACGSTLHSPLPGWKRTWVGGSQQKCQKGNALKWVSS